MIVEYPIDVPRAWTPEQVEFHRNESSWCADNALTELDALAKTGDDESPCLCDHVRFEYVGELPEP